MREVHLPMAVPHCHRRQKDPRQVHQHRRGLHAGRASPVPFGPESEPSRVGSCHGTLVIHVLWSPYGHLWSPIKTYGHGHAGLFPMVHQLTGTRGVE